MQTRFYRLAGLTDIAFSVAAASSSASLAETEGEIIGKYNQAMMCGAYMAAFTVIAQRIDDKRLEAAFETAMKRHFRETVSLGAKLKKSESVATDEFKKNTLLYRRVKSSESEIETITTSCASEILSLLK